MLVRCAARCSTNRICWPRPGWSRWSRWPTGWVCRTLADQFLTVPTDKGANAGLKVTSLVAGMVAGADSIDDMAILRHGGMRRVFDACYAPSTLGSFLRTFRFGHVRQLDAVASRTLIGLGQQVPLLPGIDEYALADMDDSIIEVHGLRQAGRRVRLHPGAGTELLHRHGQHIASSAGHRRATPPEGVLRVRPRRRPAGRRHPGHRETAPQHRRRRAGAAAGGFGVLRAQGGRRGPPGQGRRVHHGAADQAHQSRDQHDPR